MGAGARARGRGRGQGRCVKHALKRVQYSSSKSHALQPCPRAHVRAPASLRGRAAAAAPPSKSPAASLRPPLLLLRMPPTPPAAALVLPVAAAAPAVPPARCTITFRCSTRSRADRLSSNAARCAFLYAAATAVAAALPCAPAAPPNSGRHAAATSRHVPTAETARQPPRRATAANTGKGANACPWMVGAVYVRLWSPQYRCSAAANASRMPTCSVPQAVAMRVGAVGGPANMA